MSDEAEIRPFRVNMPDEAIADLRRRITATRWPSRELVADRSQGVQLATIRAPRSWAEKSYPSLSYFNEVDKGGHFAAWEQPKLFCEEMRAAFRPSRQSS